MKGFLKIFLIIIFITFSSITLRSQYIYEVLEYCPAPGQYINTHPWGVPSSANSIIGGINGSLNLGSFGGYVIFRFQNSVINHPDNPFGVDFTIFGNPLPAWSEPAIVYVMKDDNENGLADDIWYELAGSDYFFTSTIKNYSVTYYKPQQTGAVDVSWKDNFNNEGKILANSFHDNSFYPNQDSFPTISNESYTLTGTKIKGKIDKSNLASIKSYKRSFGYADNQFRGQAPYYIPDNPYTDDKENSGGDAFDIDWAIDSNGNYIYLDKIDFIKVQTAILDDAGWMGEISTEITGAAVVQANTQITGISEVIVLNIPDTITSTDFYLEAYIFKKGILQNDKRIIWNIESSNASIDNNNILRYSQTENVIITAKLEESADIYAQQNIVLIYPNEIINSTTNNEPQCFFNSTNNNLIIENAENAEIRITDICAKTIIAYMTNSSNNCINLSNLKSGSYIAIIKKSNKIFSKQFIKL